ncbi:MAG: hypothetical protein OXH98_09675 [Caldilineaceae bacterium]|nr:hypothetical protein [Caldilineaceae bacterium]
MTTDYIEELARQWLESQEGIERVRYVSDTNDQPPDFVVDDRIAVEVRRQNLMTDATKANQSVEELERPLENNIRGVLEEARPAPGDYDIHVVQCDLYRASLPDREVTREQVERAVEEYICILNEALQSQGKPVRWKTELECGVVLHFYPTSTPRDGRFVLEPEQDAVLPPSSGHVVQISIENINRCIVEKSRKIRDKICRFSEWWLVLVDNGLPTPHVGELDEWQEIRNGLVDTAPWSRIVVFSWQVHPIPGSVHHVDLILKFNLT